MTLEVGDIAKPVRRRNAQAGRIHYPILRSTEPAFDAANLGALNVRSGVSGRALRRAIATGRDDDGIGPPARSAAIPKQLVARRSKGGPHNGGHHVQ